MLDGLLITLLLGGYAYSTLIWKWMREDLRELRENHIKHLKEEVEDLKHLKDKIEDLKRRVP